MIYYTWTRICLETAEDDWFDVIESYNEVMNKVQNSTGFIEFTSVAGYRVSLKARLVSQVYEHGVEILKNTWKRVEELDEIKKETVGWKE